MKIEIVRASSDAWRLWCRDWQTLLPIAGLFLFLPGLAMLLLIAAPPSAPANGASEAEVAAFLAAFSTWLVENAGPFALSSLVSLMGSATLAVFYLDPAAATVEDALTRALALMPRFVLAGLLVIIPTLIGASIFILPGLYVIGRTSITGPVLAAQRPMSAVQALMTSVRLTRGNGLVLAGLAALLLLAGQFLPWPFLVAIEGLARAGAANPFAVALLSVPAAALAAAVSVATILLRVTIYRQLA